MIRKKSRGYKMPVVRATSEYKEFQNKVNKIAKAAPVSSSTPEEIDALMNAAKKIPTAYDPQIAKKKGAAGLQAGTVSAAVATVAYAILKEKIGPVFGSVPDEAIILILSAAIGGAVHGLQAFYKNHVTHKNFK